MKKSTRKEIKRTKRKAQGLVGPELSAIFERLVAFFRAAGVSNEELISVLQVAIRSTTKASIKKRLVAYRQFPTYDRVIFEWSSNSTYVNAAGRPRPLLLRGPNSLESIVKSLGLRQSVTAVAQELIEAGVVVGKLRERLYLNRRYSTYVGVARNVPYEPAATFLLNAVSAATAAIVDNSKLRNWKWMHSYSDRMPMTARQQLLDYAHEKAQLCCREVDEWLASNEKLHRPQSRTKAPPLMGIGIFPFIQVSTVGRQEPRVGRK